MGWFSTISEKSEIKYETAELPCGRSYNTAKDLNSAFCKTADCPNTKECQKKVSGAIAKTFKSTQPKIIY